MTQARPRDPISKRAASLNENKRMRAVASAASSPAGTRIPVIRSSETAGGASTASGPAARSDVTTGRVIACASRIARCIPSSWTEADTTIVAAA